MILINITSMDWVNLTPKVNNKFKFQLFGRTVDNLDACYSKMTQYDPEQTGLLSSHAFNLFLNSFGVFLSTQEIRTVKENFGDAGKIKYFEFIQNVRHDISQKRLATIDHCFQELSAEGVIPLAKLLRQFDAQNHPHSRCLMKDPNKIFAQFEAAIYRRSADSLHLNQSEFKQYFLDVNACIPIEREEYFVDILIHGFRLLDGRVTIERLKQLQVTIYEKVRQKTYLKKDEGLKSEANFRFFDMEDKGVVDYNRFVDTLERLGCKFTHRELRVLYAKHAGADMIMSYQEMCGLLFEMGSGLKDNQNPIYQFAKKDGFVNTPGMTKRLHI